jgi:hypothetical protein
LFIPGVAGAVVAGVGTAAKAIGSGVVAGAKAIKTISEIPGVSTVGSTVSSLIPQIPGTVNLPLTPAPSVPTAPGAAPTQPAGQAEATDQTGMWLLLGGAALALVLASPRRRKG